MPHVDEYKRNAIECFRLAKELSDPEGKTVMIKLGEAWARLAELAVKNRAGIQYEILDPRRADRPEGQE